MIRPKHEWDMMWLSRECYLSEIYKITEGTS